MIFCYVSRFAHSLLVISQITKASKDFAALVLIYLSFASFDRFLFVQALAEEGAIERCIELFHSCSFASFYNLSDIHLGSICEDRCFSASCCTSFHASIDERRFLKTPTRCGQRRVITRMNQGRALLTRQAHVCRLSSILIGCELRGIIGLLAQFGVVYL